MIASVRFTLYGWEVLCESDAVVGGWEWKSSAETPSGTQHPLTHPQGPSGVAAHNRQVHLQILLEH